MDDRTFDVIIVGGGAAGCVLAGRLSEVSNKTVLLIEAGPDAPPDEEHPDIFDSYAVSHTNPRFSWPSMIAEVGPDLGGGKPRFSRHYLQGRGVGGGSNIMGMMAVRGVPEDYNEWREYGVKGWSWKEVLPYFKKLERDLNFGGPLHGDSGPLPIRRVPTAEWAPLAKAFAAAAMRRGYPLVEDYNADFRDGVCPVPLSNLPERRVSASMAYLTKAVRSRPNLTLLADAFAERLEIRNGTACGVVVRTAAGVRTIAGREIVVTCGALFSPALLLRSGIGPGAHLQAIGMEVVRDLPGVGRNLQNHPLSPVAMHLRSGSRQLPAHRTWGQNCLRYSSKVEGCPPADMLLLVQPRPAWHLLGRHVGGIGVGIYKAFSKGTVELASTDPAVAPRVCMNLLDDSRDFQRMLEGFRLVFELLADPAMVDIRNQVFLPNGKIMRRLGQRNRLNGLQATAIAAILDFSPFRSIALRNSTLDVVAVAKDESALRDIVRRGSGVAHHVCGTCRMGTADDREAVVDSVGRVHGVGGLRVSDTSIFPTVVSANTHIPVVMTAEKMADHIKADWS